MCDLDNVGLYVFYNTKILTIISHILQKNARKERKKKTKLQVLYSKLYETILDLKT